MNFDINSVLMDMGEVMKSNFVDDLGDVDEYVRKILDTQRVALGRFAEQRIVGDITENEFNYFIEHEKSVIKLELLAINNLTITSAQNAANAALHVFSSASKRAL